MAPDKIYVVIKGGKPGVYGSWDEAKTEVLGVSSRHKSFTTEQMARSFILAEDPSLIPKLDEFLSNRNSLRTTDNSGTMSNIQYTQSSIIPFIAQDQHHVTVNNSQDNTPPSQPVQYEPYIAPITNITQNVVSVATRSFYLTEDHFNDVRVVGKYDMSIAPQSPNVVLNFDSDGSCLRNGTNGAIAGMGIVCEQLNLELSVTLPPRIEGQIRYTNNRAELAAILYIIKIVRRYKLMYPRIYTLNVNIRCDSQYVVELSRGKLWDNMINHDLWSMYFNDRHKLADTERVIISIVKVRREEISRADELSGIATSR